MTVPNGRARGRPATDPQPLPASARKQVSGENFPVALRILPGPLRSALLALYAYARYVDDLGDEFIPDGHDVTAEATRAARRGALLRVAEQVRDVYAGGAATVPAVSGLSLLREQYGVPADPFLDLVRANLADQDVARYPLFTDLLDYCALSADPVGRVVMCVLGEARAPLLRQSDRICTALQIIEHIQDVAEDLSAGRIYLPLEDLQRFGVDESDLGRPSASPAVVRLIRFETDRALAFLDEGTGLLGRLQGWGRLAVTGFVAGGRAAVGRIRSVGHDVLAHHTSPGSARVAAAGVGLLLRRPG